MKAGDKRAVAIFYTLFLTGARVSEMLQLEPKDVQERMTVVKGKGSKYRDLFLPKKAQTYLEDYLTERVQKGEGLFSGREGTITRQTVHQIIKKYAGLARVKLSRAHAHNFRHLYGMYLGEEGLSIDEIADLLGHSNINITRIYTRKTKKELMAAINNLGTKKKRRVKIDNKGD
jgi:integrase/recombinase XerD